MSPAAAFVSTGRSPDPDMQALKCPDTDDASVLRCAPPGHGIAYRRPGHEIKKGDPAYEPLPPPTRRETLVSKAKDQEGS